MQENGPGAAMLLVPTVKTRATDFSIAAIMARGPRAERRSTCVPTSATSAQHTVGLPTLGKCKKNSESGKQRFECLHLVRYGRVLLRHFFRYVSKCIEVYGVLPPTHKLQEK